jgi:hypothetical protein
MSDQKGENEAVDDSPTATATEVRRKLPRATIIWAVLSVTFFVITVWLVGVLYGSTEAPDRAPKDFATGEAVQTLTLYVVRTASTPDLVATTGYYHTGDRGEATNIDIDLHAAEYFLLIDGVTDTHDCYLDYGFTGQMVALEGSPLLSDVPDSLWKFHVPFDAADRQVVCNLYSVLRYPTFPQRAVSIRSFVFPTEGDNFGSLVDAGTELQQAGAVPVNAIDLDFANPTASNYHFVGGHEPEARVDPKTGAVDRSETVRSLQADDETLEVRWTDERAESEKELLLILIGVLIAFGTAMLIEAVRPYVERI